MNQRVLQAYANNQIETGVASERPVELVVMVYERIFELLNQAESALLAGQTMEPFISKALELTNVGLQSCLNPTDGGEIAKNLTKLYDWANRQILLGKLNKDPQPWIDVRRVLTPLLEAWREIAQAQSEVAQAQSMQNLPLERSSSVSIAIG